MSFPPGTEMFQFPGFAFITLCIQVINTWFRSQTSDYRFQIAPLARTGLWPVA